MRRLPSRKTLNECFGVPLLKEYGLEEVPAKVRTIRSLLESVRVNESRSVDIALEGISTILGFHGVEALRVPGEQVDRCYYDTVALYCNPGDPYVTTILFDTDFKTFHVTSYGDWVERAESTRGYKFE